ncbi:MAG: hypothetical protein BGO55_16595 [Sphingobacteriales bacterium 50-39]|nr:hypothetical protein [Sphingobacteriales bacterium]OJW56608.1 MAG: hypothetical protein BGO55_16595 [Sphingobacteriales bacterium 50-39]
MARARKIRFHSFFISVTKKEYEKIKEGYAATTCRSMSEYVRRLMFDRPITVCYRNRAFDEFIEEAIRLRKTLLLFCNQGGLKDLERNELIQKIEEIRSVIIKISETCSPK